MRGAPITKLGVGHLEHVFLPPGLPLPFKGKEDVGTTSVLVRGGAGVGKTTLALALAHSIADASSGAVLYLTTEFSPVEIAFKASMLGLPEDAVRPWPGSEPVPAGAILVEHLANTAPAEASEEEPSSDSNRNRRRSLEAVWNLLHPEEEVAAARAVRAVVIDALTLLEPQANERALRAELIDFVQALEGEGRSVVLVEELGHGTPAWSAFVVDLVLELAMTPHPRTGELQRKLTLSKCRYAISIPGPHDYGLEGGRPTVWPDLLRVVAGRKESHGLRLAKPPRLALPIGVRGKWQRLESRVGVFEGDHIDLIDSIESTPGVVAVHIYCGPVVRLSPVNGGVLELSEAESPHAIGWTLQTPALAHVNTCIFENLESLVLRAGEDTVIHLLEALAQLGYLVVVRVLGRLQFSALRANAHYVWGERLHPWAPAPSVRKSFALAHLEARTAFKDGMDKYRMLWRKHLHGREWSAAWHTLLGIQSEKAAPALSPLWLALCAELAGHRKMTKALMQYLRTPLKWLALDPLLRLLARTGNFTRAEQIAREFCTSEQQPDWMLQRMLVEAGLAAPEREGAQTLERLAGLLKDDQLPAKDRSELFFNLAASKLESCGYDHELLRESEYNAALTEVEQALAEGDSDQALMQPVPSDAAGA